MGPTQKVTVTLRDDSVEAIRNLVADGHADSVAAFVRHATTIALEDLDIAAMIAAADSD